MRRLASLLLAVALVTAPVPAAAQDDETGPLPLSVDGVDHSGYPEVELTVTAPREMIGTDLPSEAFTLWEDERVAEFTVNRLPADDLEVVLAIDTSGSMGLANMEAAKQAALAFTEHMPGSVGISVIKFDNEPEVVLPLTTDRPAIVEAISGLASGGRTALYDAIATSVRQFTVEEGVRPAVVLLSDGGDNNSQATLEDTLESLHSTDVALHIVELITPEIDQEALRQLAGAGDGSVVSADDSAALEAVYDEIASKLVSQYKLSYTSTTGDSTELRVRIESEGLVAEGSRTVQLPSQPPEPTPSPVATSEAMATPTVRPGSFVTPGLLAGRWTLYLGAAAFYLALAMLILLLLAPRGRQAQVLGGFPLRGTGSSGHLQRFAERASLLADDALDRSGRSGKFNRALERAGIPLRPGEFAVLAVCSMVTALAIGLMVANWLAALALAATALLGARLLVSFLTERRQARFASQLGDALQLMAGSLRAGYGLMQSIDAVAKEAPEPSGEEFRRLITESRLGRDAHDALHAMADRVNSEDFRWIVQAIEIHRDVGGDLAEVLDNVAATIRERDQLRRQVKALSAEGRLSALILLLLPVGLSGLLLIINPDYLGELVRTTPGRVMLTIGLLLMTAGTLWLRRIVRLVY